MEKNWCDLPAELMLECIKKMDLKSRWKMRRTARMEKELVESKRYSDIEEIYIKFMSPNTLQLQFPGDRDPSDNVPIDRSTIQLVLKMGAFKKVNLDCNTEGFRVLLEVSKNTPLHAEKVKLYAVSKNDLQILKSCRGVKELSICNIVKRGLTTWTDFKDVLELIRTVPTFKLSHLYEVNADEIIHLIQKILDNKLPNVRHFVIESIWDTVPADLDFFEAIRDRFEAKIIREKHICHTFDKFYIPLREQECIKFKYRGYDYDTTIIIKIMQLDDMASDEQEDVPEEVEEIEEDVSDEEEEEYLLVEEEEEMEEDVSEEDEEEEDMEVDVSEDDTDEEVPEEAPVQE